VRIADSNIIGIENEIITTLKYFNLFKHPLNADEVYEFLAVKADREQLLHILNTLVASNRIYLIDGFYMPEHKPAYVTRRREGAERAQKLMKKAQRAANIISKFPFVKCVCLSGSLSKGYANEKSDIDFFIITNANRLWICRSLLHMYKKLTYLWGGQHSYCMNYFIDESMLCLEEQNRFTATEIATMMPVYNLNTHSDLVLSNNDWLVNTFPNKKWQTAHPFNELKHKGLRIAAERILNFLRPKALNAALMQLTDKMWRSKWKKRGFPMEEYELAMKTRWYVSKNHPLNYQRKVLAEIAESKQVPV
jgi:predicted nucleotidyltransferase